MHLKPICIALMVGALCSACNTRTAFLSTQELQRAQCDQITDAQQFQRCRAEARQTYEDYQRQQETLKPAP